MQNSLSKLLENVDTFPVMGEILEEYNTLVLDLSPANPDLEKLDLSDTKKFDDYVFDLISKAKKKYGIGGYFEHRAIYSRSSVFATDLADFRDIHMGVDIWGQAWTPVFAPLDGIVHSFQDNAGFGNYGPTIILEHELDGQKLFSLYGHLALEDLKDLQVGQSISKGQRFCHLGPFPENGDWPPHLHFQLMWDMMGMFGDFPGVCSHREVEKFRKICPDPNLLIPFLR
ncbi:peptidoglycan DD-metalloendopeptidase family protein [Arthrospiribacter ruber]|uniref:Peptidase M23 n=1 Tax=Arthrospiribacter ruber TaxID=2487934 RepID=A0A951MC88_9BACT|nr:peptidoglycan DD-metalloendopeptidase family protein [Arthrospiribacter ruber]MBW3467694.1 peptidase M23 [Arthrospiribacter ruber]